MRKLDHVKIASEFTQLQVKNIFLSEVINILRSYTTFSFQFEDLGCYTDCLHSQVSVFSYTGVSSSLQFHLKTVQVSPGNLSRLQFSMHDTHQPGTSQVSVTDIR
jgi:hypothetical protein